MSSDTAPIMTEVDLTCEMSPPPSWTPGNYLNTGDFSVVDMNTPVFDPAMQARGQKSSLFGERMTPELAYKTHHSMDTCSRIPRGTAYFLLGCCAVAVFSLGLLAYVNL